MRPEPQSINRDESLPAPLCPLLPTSFTPFRRTAPRSAGFDRLKSVRAMNDASCVAFQPFFTLTFVAVGF